MSVGNDGPSDTLQFRCGSGAVKKAAPRSEGLHPMGVWRTAVRLTVGLDSAI